MHPWLGEWQTPSHFGAHQLFSALPPAAAALHFVRFLLAATAWTAVCSPASVGVLPQGTQVQPLL